MPKENYPKPRLSIRTSLTEIRYNGFKEIYLVKDLAIIVLE
jgi:hypothetical protein